MREISQCLGDWNASCTRPVPATIPQAPLLTGENVLIKWNFIHPSFIMYYWTRHVRSAGIFKVGEILGKHQAAWYMWHRTEKQTCFINQKQDMFRLIKSTEQEREQEEVSIVTNQNYFGFILASIKWVLIGCYGLLCMFFVLVLLLNGI